MEAPYALPPVIAHALEQPNGARFFRCALQVNPYAYFGRHGKDSAFDTEAQYNQALIEACQRVGIEAIAVTDHFRIRESWALIEAVRQAGIFVFPGFEAAASDGVHFLCLYEPDRAEAIERYIGDLGVTDSSKPSPLSKFNSSELPRQVRQQGGIAIAAHACASNGILKHLKGQPRIDAWKSPDLLACAIAGTVEDTPQECREILMNKNADHRRQFPLAIIQANDVNKPEDLDQPQTLSLIHI
jgi:hypothetical protein